MAQELKRCWKRFILPPTKTPYLEMCLLWFLEASEWVRAITSFITSFMVSFVPFITSMLLNFTPGTPALTSRGFVEEDFAKVAEYFDAAVKLALKIKAETQGSENL